MELVRICDSKGIDPIFVVAIEILRVSEEKSLKLLDMITLLGNI